MKKMKYILVFAGVLNSGISNASDSNIEMSTVAPYYDENVIQANILSECNQLGAQFSDSTYNYLQKNGFTVSRKNDDQMSKEGKILRLKIANAVSSGNAFTGHRKSVSIIAELYEGQELVDTYKHSRDSGGGFMGGFKGSCAILKRCVNTLGNDVAKWMVKNK